ncbi:putative transporter MCH2 [Fusarium oxysporum f. sp. albedinis]|nr:putative transporter MCH2 [Fusarium oxysporum f. sp. albedinis]
MIRSSSATPAKSKRKGMLLLPFTHLFTLYSFEESKIKQDKHTPTILTQHYPGTRIVTTLTPAQLARKRANDRDAQRAIRARTKEHIERLKRELAELKSEQRRDQVVQELLHRNKAIEKELIRLKEVMRAPMNSSSYSAPGLTPQPLSLPDEHLTSTVYGGDPKTNSDIIPSSPGSPFSSDYNFLPIYSQQYIPLSKNYVSLASAISYPIPSNISTPPSSADYSAGYIQISVPTSNLPSNDTSSSSLASVCGRDFAKVEYNDVGHHDTISRDLPLPNARYDEETIRAHYLDVRFLLSNPPLLPSTPHSHPYMSHHQQQQSTWNMYHMYYSQPNSSVRQITPAVKTGMYPG